MKYVFGHSGPGDLIFGNKKYSPETLGNSLVPFSNQKSAKRAMLGYLYFPEGSGTVYRLVPVYKAPGRIKR